MPLMAVLRQGVISAGGDVSVDILSRMESFANDDESVVATRPLRVMALGSCVTASSAAFGSALRTALRKYEETPVLAANTVFQLLQDGLLPDMADGMCGCSRGKVLGFSVLENVYSAVLRGVVATVWLAHGRPDLARRTMPRLNATRETMHRRCTAPCTDLGIHDPQLVTYCEACGSSAHFEAACDTDLYALQYQFRTRANRVAGDVISVPGAPPEACVFTRNRYRTPIDAWAPFVAKLGDADGVARAIADAAAARSAVAELQPVVEGGGGPPQKKNKVVLDAEREERKAKKIAAAAEAEAAAAKRAAAAGGVQIEMKKAAKVAPKTRAERDALRLAKKAPKLMQKKLLAQAEREVADRALVRGKASST